MRWFDHRPCCRSCLHCKMFTVHIKVMMLCGGCVGATSFDTGQRQPSNQGQCSRGGGQDALQHAPATAPGPSPPCVAEYVHPPCLPCSHGLALLRPISAHSRPISAHLSSTPLLWTFCVCCWGLAAAAVTWHWLLAQHATEGTLCLTEPGLAQNVSKFGGTVSLVGTRGITSQCSVL